MFRPSNGSFRRMLAAVLLLSASLSVGPSAVVAIGTASPDLAPPPPFADLSGMWEGTLAITSFASIDNWRRPLSPLNEQRPHRLLLKFDSPQSGKLRSDYFFFPVDYPFSYKDGRLTASYDWVNPDYPAKDAAKYLHARLEATIEASASGYTLKGTWRQKSGSLEGHPDDQWIESQGTINLSKGSSGADATGKPLCEEAVEWDSFGAKAAGDTTNILLDHQQLRVSFDQAIKRYEAENPAGGPARISVNPKGSLQALQWLFAEGGEGFGNSQDKAYEYVALPKGDAEKARRGKESVDGKVAPYVLKPGTEPKLRQAMADYYEGKVKQGIEDARLTPGEVFYLALKERGGDAREAMLLAHNTLRSLARDRDAELTGVDKDDAFTAKYLQAIRKGDNMGPWYHLFGTGFFEMETRSDCGWMNVLSPLTASYDTFWGATAKLKDALKSNPNIDTPSNRTELSAFANFMEQFYREKRGGRERDLEKFCFNVWGGQIGAWLAKERLPMTGGPGCKGQGPPSAPGAISQYQFDMSPVNITWEGGGKKMTLDQKTARITGSFSFQVMPFYEPDEDSWAAAWGDPGDTPYRLTFEAVKDGEMHFFSVDANSGKTVVYAPKIKTGERLAIDIKPNQLGGEMRRSDGSVVAPTTVEVDLKTSGSPGGDDPSTTIFLSIFAAMAMGAAATVTVLRRRRPAISTVSPSAPSAVTVMAPPVVAQPARQSSIASPQEPVSAPTDPAGLHGPQFCSQCGNHLLDGARFCQTCGAPVAALSPGNCPGCGKPLAPGARLCGDCGAPATNPALIRPRSGGFAVASQAARPAESVAQPRRNTPGGQSALFLLGLLFAMLSVVAPYALFASLAICVLLSLRGARKRAVLLILASLLMLMLATVVTQVAG